VVINRELLAFADLAPAEVQDVSLQDARDKVGVTGMVDKLSARPTYATIEGPVVIQDEEVLGSFLLAPLSLPWVQPLACVFDHLSVRRNILSGVDPPAVDSRAPQAQAEATALRVDLVSRRSHWHKGNPKWYGLN